MTEVDKAVAHPPGNDVPPVRMARFRTRRAARPKPLSKPKKAPPIVLPGSPEAIVTAIAVAMSLFHLYCAVAGAWPFTDFPIVATQPLRYAHVAFVLVLCFLLFPLAARYRNQIRWWDVVCGAAAVAILHLRHRRWRGFHRSCDDAEPHGCHPRRDLHRTAAGSVAPHHRTDRSAGGDRVHRLRDGRALSAAAVEPSRLWPRLRL